MSEDGASGNWQFKPGDSVVQDDARPDEAPHMPSEVAAEAPAEPASAAPAATDGGFGQNDAKPHASHSEDSVSWSASEFIAHEKGVGWYLALAGATILFTALIFLLTKDKISSGAVAVAAIVFGAYAARKPRTLEYRLNASGLSIAGKFYDYGQFRSFTNEHDDALSSITFMPLRRFMPALTIYYSPADEQKILQLLSDRLPFENRGRDVVDRFLHRIRF